MLFDKICAAFYKRVASVIKKNKNMVHGTHNALPDKRNENILIYINGELKKRAEAKISVFDSGYLVGDGIWEALRLHEGVLVFLDQHLDRLWQGAATVGMDLGMTREELVEKVWMTLRANDMHDHVHVRFMLTRGIKKNTFTRSTINHQWSQLSDHCRT